MLLSRLIPATLLLVCYIVVNSSHLAWAANQDLWTDAGIVKLGEKKPIPAPNFTLEALNGKKVSLKDFKGKVVFLNFWATWCPPCVVEMPSMEALHKKFNKFIKKKGYTFLVLLDSDGTVTSDSYRAIGFPTTYLIDKHGNVVGKAEGAREWNSIESFKL